jgi:hypothetical protein
MAVNVTLDGSRCAFDAKGKLVIWDWRNEGMNFELEKMKPKNQGVKRKHLCTTHRLENVPGGQSKGSVLLYGQYFPTGHGT